MYEVINKELMEVKERLRDKERLQTMLDLTRESLNKEKGYIDNLVECIAKNEEKINKLEKISVASVLLSIFGNKKEKVKELRRQIALIKRRCDEGFKYINQLENDILRYNNKLKEYKFEEDRHQYLMERKGQLILQSEDKYSKEFASLMEESSDLELSVAEISEAVRSGRLLVDSLQGAIIKLENAKLYGNSHSRKKSVLTSYMRQSSVDDSMEYLFAARMAATAFKRELADLKIYQGIYIANINIDKDSNYRMEGFFKDATIQLQIKNSMESLNETKKKVEALLKGLEEGHEKSMVRLAEVKAKIDYILQRTK